MLSLLRMVLLLKGRGGSKEPSRNTITVGLDSLVLMLKYVDKFSGYNSGENIEVGLSDLSITLTKV